MALRRFALAALFGLPAIGMAQAAEVAPYVAMFPLASIEIEGVIYPGAIRHELRRDCGGAWQHSTEITGAFGTLWSTMRERADHREVEFRFGLRAGATVPERRIIATRTAEGWRIDMGERVLDAPGDLITPIRKIELIMAAAAAGGSSLDLDLLENVIPRQDEDKPLSHGGIMVSPLHQSPAGPVFETIETQGRQDGDGPMLSEMTTYGPLGAPLQIHTELSGPQGSMRVRGQAMDVRALPEPEGCT